MIFILKGDDTGANNRSLKMVLPTLNISSGYRLKLVFEGIETDLGDVTSGTIEWNYSKSQTSNFKYGIHFASLILYRNDLSQTVSNTIPICITDSVEDVYGPNELNVCVKLNGVIPFIDISELKRADTNGDIKAAFNALLAILKQASGQ